MTSRFLIFLTTILCFYTSNLVVESRKGVSSKDVVKTIKTENGVYDCVDFYKQPAFNHPELKNHSFHPQMRPSFTPTWPNDDKFSNEVAMDMNLKGDTCPSGTVPIRRFNGDDDLLQTQARLHSYAQLGRNHTNGWSPSNLFFSLGQSKSYRKRLYNGVAAKIIVYNPYNIQKTQYSSAEIILKRGNGAIIVGWTANPTVYKDNRTRFFIYTVSGHSHCMNSECGFVQVRTDVTLDFLIEPVTTIGGPDRVFRFFVYQDPKNGNWWLQIGPQDTIIGFWPQKFFQELNQSSDYIACGGEVYSPPEFGLPDMGSGFKPQSKSHPGTTFCLDVKTVDEGHNVAINTDLEPFSNREADYPATVYDKGDYHYVLFGGPKN